MTTVYVQRKEDDWLEIRSQDNIYLVREEEIFVNESFGHYYEFFLYATDRVWTQMNKNSIYWVRTRET